MGMARATQCKRGRYRIETAAAQGLAARDAPQAEEASAGGAEACDRRSRIVRTARIEAAARAEQRTEQALVDGEQGKDQAGHGERSVGVHCACGISARVGSDSTAGAASQCIRRRGCLAPTANSIRVDIPALFKWLLLGVS